MGAKKLLTRTEALRKLGDRSRGPTAEDTIVIDTLADFEEIKDTLVEFGEKASEYSISDLEEIAGAFSALVGDGLVSAEDATAFDETVQNVEFYMRRIDEAQAVEFGEAYDAVTEAWESYVNVKEQDRYDGKADDVLSAWEEVTSALHAFADLADEVGVE